MPSILSKNCITSGVIDFYCLVCSVHFRYEMDAIRHIVSDASHNLKLDSFHYVEKHKADFIRKIRSIYFCEGCDMIFPTITKVGLHIKDSEHILKLRDINPNPICRQNNYILSYNNILITERAWNGVIENTCVICNTEFDRESDHLAEETHVLNQIKSNIVVKPDEKDIIYRKIDKHIVQCLTCNEMIPETEIMRHISYADHKQAYKHFNKDMFEINSNYTGTIKIDNVDNKHANYEKNKTLIKDSIVDTDGRNDTNTESLKQNNMAKEHKDKKVVASKASKTGPNPTQRGLNTDEGYSLNAKQPQKPDLRKTSRQNTKNQKSTLIDMVDKYREQKIYLNLIAETAVCKICFANVDFNVDAIEKHIEYHQNPVKKREEISVKSHAIDKAGTSSSNTKTYNKRLSPSEEANDFARKNAMMRVTGDRMERFYCNPCNVLLSPKLWNLKTHVFNTDHTDNIKLQNHLRVGKLQKTHNSQFITSIELIDVNGDVFCLINDTHMFPGTNLILVSKLIDKFFCKVCDIDMNIENLKEHIETDSHTNAVENSNVISSMPHEFIRQIRYEQYHCGYCDHFESDWEDMLDHITTQDHYLHKAESQNLLEQFREKKQARLFQASCINEFIESFHNKNFF